MDNLKIENEQFSIDLINDIQKIYKIFRTNTTIENPIETHINHQINLSVLKKKSKSMIFHNVFITLVDETQKAILKNDMYYFFFLVSVIKNIYFSQKQEYIKIQINIESLECINNYIACLQEINTHDIGFAELLRHTIENLDNLKSYCTFDIVIDNNSYCVGGADYIAILEEIEHYEKQLDEYYKVINTN